MMRKARVYVHKHLAGELLERDSGSYLFTYDAAYLSMEGAKPISLTMPLRDTPYESKTMFPFFDGLIPEGWLLDLTVRNWKIDPRDRMGLLLTACHDCIGAVHLEDASP
jgi:serine/threonine-protein kinase HipA